MDQAAPEDGERQAQMGTTAAIAPLVAGRGDHETITDAELVAALRAGDDRAFERLYTRYHRRIASYVYGMVHDYGRAEDITQDVFMSALRRMRETDREIAFKPWIYEIAKNACIDQFRRSRRAEEVSYDAEEGLGAADYGRLVQGGASPDAAVDAKQQLDHLCGAFGGLSETHHDILVMRELEGLSYREIGERLGMTRPSVESTLFRARRRLAEEYDELVSGERCSRVQTIIASCVDGALGARDRRRMARHVSYCQPCRRHARLAGVDPADLVVRPVRAKIAAVLPLPAFLKHRWAGETWTAQAGTLDPALVSNWLKAAVTAATVAIAGVGAGVVGGPGDMTLRAALPGGSLIAPSDGGDGDHRDGDRDAPVVADRPDAAPVAPSGSAGRSVTGSSGGDAPSSSGAGTSTSSTSQGQDPLAPATDQLQRTVTDTVDQVTGPASSLLQSPAPPTDAEGDSTAPTTDAPGLPTLQAPAASPGLPDVQPPSTDALDAEKSVEGAGGGLTGALSGG